MTRDEVLSKARRVVETADTPSLKGQLETLNEVILARRLLAYDAALVEIAKWSQELQDKAEAQDMGIAQWRGCVAIASRALEGETPHA